MDLRDQPCPFVTHDPHTRDPHSSQLTWLTYARPSPKDRDVEQLLQIAKTLGCKEDAQLAIIQGLHQVVVKTLVWFTHGGDNLIRARGGGGGGEVR